MEIIEKKNNAGELEKIGVLMDLKDAKELLKDLQLLIEEKGDDIHIITHYLFKKLSENLEFML